MVSFSVKFFAFAVLFALMMVVTVEARNLNYYGYEDLPEEYRLAQWDVPHKRVPSAGDMMVRFGKRSV